jgi:hypothetical protein
LIALREGRLTFSFDMPAAVQYDGWSFYRNRFNSACGGTKAVDFVALDADVTWLIEVKDYRLDRRTKLVDLADEVAIKVRDTLAGLVAAQSNANDPDERSFAKAAVQRRLKVVLHLEQPAIPSRLFPQVADPSKLTLALKQRLKSIDAHPHVVDQQRLASLMHWTVTG